MSARTHRILTVSLVLTLGIAVFFGVRDLGSVKDKGVAGKGQGTAPAKASPETVEAQSIKTKARPDSAKAALMDRLRGVAERRNATELIALVPLLHENGQLLDEEVTEIYNVAIQSFDPLQLADLANAWPDETNTPYSNIYARIGGLIRERDKPEQYFQFMGRLSPENRNRDSFILKVGQRMSMFAPDQIGNYLDQFPQRDKRAIGNVLVTRVDQLRGSVQEKVDFTYEYTKVLTDLEMIQPVLAARVSLIAPGDPLAALDWVYEQDSTLVALCDVPLIKALVSSYPGEATAYVNEILAGEDRPRADKALQAMVEGYTRKDPERALQWVLGLPEDAGVFDQLIVTPFMKIKTANPERAKQIIESTTDPKVKELMERVSR